MGRAYKKKQISNYGRPFMLLISYMVLLFFPVVVLVECISNSTSLWHEIKKVWESLILA